jgi:replicative DNA helicase
MGKHERQEYTEREWLGLIIKNKSLWDDKTVGEEHFKASYNKELYKLIEKLIQQDRPLDQNTWNKLSENEIHRIGGIDRIRECERLILIADDHGQKRVERDLHTYHMAESMINAVKVLPQKESYDIEECRAIAEQIQQAVEGVRTKRKSFIELMDETQEKQMNMKDGMSGIDTGYVNLNMAFDGWQPKDLILCGARPSMG